jgi:hypothetical protein
MTCAIVSRPTTSGRAEGAAGGAAQLLAGEVVDHVEVRPYFSTSRIVASMPAMPTRLAMKLGVSLARTTPLPRPLVTKLSSWSTIAGSVVGVAINSTSTM